MLVVLQSAPPSRGELEKRNSLVMEIISPTSAHQRDETRVGLHCGPSTRPINITSTSAENRRNQHQRQSPNSHLSLSRLVSSPDTQPLPLPPPPQPRTSTTRANTKEEAETDNRVHERAQDECKLLLVGSDVRAATTNGKTIANGNINTMPSTIVTSTQTPIANRMTRSTKTSSVPSSETKLLCHSILLLLLLGLHSPTLAQSSQTDPKRPPLGPTDQASMAAELLPPYAPTRRPPSLVQPTPPNASSDQSQPAQVTFGAAASLTGAALATSASATRLSAAPEVDGDEMRRSGSSHKFARINELDAFLDDMDHTELRTVASGRPIDNLFHPRSQHQSANASAPLNAANLMTSGGHLNYLHQELAGAEPEPADKQQSRRQLEPTERAAPPTDEQSLDSGAQSRQQIYSECALILQRTYVKNIDDPKHQLVPFGKTEQACISYKDIDKAVEQAKSQLKFRELAKKRKKLSKAPVAAGILPIPPFEIIHSTLEPPEDLVAAIGEINMATTQIIADKFDLSNDELLNGLPLIDMSKTKFWDICPLLVKQDINCEISRFRSFTGHCNNLKHPTWGAAMTPFARYLPPVHPDGIWIPRKSIITEITFDLPPTTQRLHPHPHPQHHHDHHHPMHSLMHSSVSPTIRFPVYAESYGPHSVVPDPRSPAAPTPPNDHFAHHHHQLRMMQTELPDMAAAASVQLQRRAPVNGIAFTDEFAEPSPTELAPAHFHESHRLSSSAPTTAARLHHEQVGGAPFGEAASGLQPPPPVPLVPEPATGMASAQSEPKSHHRRPMPVDLPSPRLITSIVHRDMDHPVLEFSILFMSWGQLLDHDMTRAAQPPATIKCCGQESKPKHKLCLPISVPPNDPFYSKFNVQCLEFRRSLAGVRPNCVLGPRVHQNAITSHIDANFVYGSSQAHADALRLFKNGRLRDRDWFKAEGLKPLLPGQEQLPDQDCIARPKDLFCFLAGDVRANEQTHLTVLHTIYMREHNRIADKLTDLNPHWDDERTYHETRHIMAAGVQHVLINEYIPLLIGKKMTELYNLTAQSNDDNHQHRGPHHHVVPTRGKYAFWHGYDSGVTTSVSNSFAAAAFRQGHTFVQGSVERYNKFHEFVAREKLRHLFKQPFLLYQPGVMDELTLGMVNQPAQSYDPFISEDISGHLFQPPELAFGHDLAAINLQRGRDQGLPGYNLFREWCGLPRAETFEQLEPYLTNRTAYHYSRLYKHVDDIDLWSGGISERKLPGAAIGPTFACIIARQFSNTRRGDRFWYENPGLPSSFTPEQLAEIRKISLAKILCANSDDLPTIQRWALRMAHPVLNPRVQCDQLPEIDLGFWQEE